MQEQPLPSVKNLMEFFNTEQGLQKQALPKPKDDVKRLAKPGPLKAVYLWGVQRAEGEANQGGYESFVSPVTHAQRPMENRNQTLHYQISQANVKLALAKAESVRKKSCQGANDVEKTSSPSAPENLTDNCNNSLLDQNQKTKGSNNKLIKIPCDQLPPKHPKKRIKQVKRSDSGTIPVLETKSDDTKLPRAHMQTLTNRPSVIKCPKLKTTNSAFTNMTEVKLPSQKIKHQYETRTQLKGTHDKTVPPLPMSSKAKPAKAKSQFTSVDPTVHHPTKAAHKYFMSKSANSSWDQLNPGGVLGKKRSKRYGDERSSEDTLHESDSNPQTSSDIGNSYNYKASNVTKLKSLKDAGDILTTQSTVADWESSVRPRDRERLLASEHKPVSAASLRSILTTVPCTLSMPAVSWPSEPDIAQLDEEHRTDILESSVPRSSLLLSVNFASELESLQVAQEDSMQQVYPDTATTETGDVVCDDNGDSKSDVAFERIIRALQNACPGTPRTPTSSLDTPPTSDRTHSTEADDDGLFILNKLYVASDVTLPTFDASDPLAASMFYTQDHASHEECVDCKSTNGSIPSMRPFQTVGSSISYGMPDGSALPSYRKHPDYVDSVTALEDTKSSLRAADKVLQQLDSRWKPAETSTEQSLPDVSRLLQRPKQVNNSCKGAAADLRNDHPGHIPYLPALKMLLSKQTVLTYTHLRKASKLGLPKKLPGFETNTAVIKSLHRDILFVMRPHERDGEGRYPKLLGPNYLHLLKYKSDAVCVGAGDYGIVSQAQSYTTNALYAVKYYLNGTRPATDYLRDMLREAAVQQEAHKLVPSMVPAVKGFVVIHDPSNMFVPCVLVTEFIPVTHGSMNALALSTAMKLQAYTKTPLFLPDVWLDLTEQLVRGFKLLYDHAITHNDVKADNILLNISRERITPVIIDFGHAMCPEYDINMSQKVPPCEQQFPDIIRELNEFGPELLIKRKITINADVYGMGLIFKRIGAMLGMGKLSKLGEKMRTRNAEHRMHWPTVEMWMQTIVKKSTESTDLLRKTQLKNVQTRNQVSHAVGGVLL